MYTVFKMEASHVILHFSKVEDLKSSFWRTYSADLDSCTLYVMRNEKRGGSARWQLLVVSDKNTANCALPIDMPNA